jgi:hypothetical protein
MDVSVPDTLGNATRVEVKTLVDALGRCYRSFSDLITSAMLVSTSCLSEYQLPEANDF